MLRGRRWHRPGVVSLVLVLVATACGRQAPESPAMVFAAASLGAPFEAIAKAFSAERAGREVSLHFAGTPQLVLQVKEGAPVDVFASADLPNMQKLVEANLTGSQPRVFARNSLTIVTAPGNPKGIRALGDLARADLRVVLCGPQVPAGRYAREALAKARVEVRSLSDEPNVKAVVGKVQLGEVDAGIVYLTDAKGAGAKVEAVPIAGAHNVVASYPIAVLTSGKSRRVGEELLAFVLSDAGQHILRSFGFEPP